MFLMSTNMSPGKIEQILNQDIINYLSIVLPLVRNPLNS